MRIHPIRTFLAAAALLLPAFAGAKTESPWRSTLAPAVETLRSNVRNGSVSVDFPPGILDGFAAAGNRPDDRLMPIVEQLDELKIDAETFSNLPDKQETLTLAIKEAFDHTRLEAENLILLAGWLDLPDSKTDPRWLRQKVDALLYGRQFLVPRDVRPRLQAARSQIRARLLRDAQERVEKTEAAGEVGLRLRVTRNFLADTKSFGREDWRRLQREIDKIGPALESGDRPTGERGNLKFITGGELAGLAEIKTGPQRTNRVIWTFDRRLDRVVLLRHVQRTDIEPESQGHRNLVSWTNPVHVQSQLADTSLELQLKPIIPLKRRVAVGKSFDIRKVKISD